MKTISIILISLFSFKSCLKPSSTLNIVLEDANGLQKGSKLKCKGLEVGIINNIKITGNIVVATIALDKDFQATKGSTVQVDVDNVFGKKSLLISPATTTEMLTDGDTIYAIAGNNYSILDNLIKKGNIDSLMQNINIDSLQSKLDSIDVKSLIKKAEKLVDLNKLLN